MVVETLPEDPMRESILDRKRQKLRLRQEKMQLSKTIRNAKRRQHRLRGKAREMTDEDLIAVLMMRKDVANAKARRLENSGSLGAGAAMRAEALRGTSPVPLSSAASSGISSSGLAATPGATEAEAVAVEAEAVDGDADPLNLHHDCRMLPSVAVWQRIRQARRGRTPLAAM